MPRLNIRELAARAGFSGRALDTIVAIVMAESGGNPRAYNGNRGTGDSSYGLAQINMLGAMGPERRKAYGLSSNDDLFDPLTNLRVAYKLSNGGRDFSPWTTYKNGLHEKYLGSSGANIRVAERTGRQAPAPTMSAPVVAEPLETRTAARATPGGGIYEQVMGSGAAGVTDLSNPAASVEDDFIDPFDLPDTEIPRMGQQDYDSLYSGSLTPSAEIYDKVQSTLPTPENPRQADRASDTGGPAGKIVRLAESFVGTPYVWGGTSPSGFDCSGLLQYVFRKAGVDLPRVSYQQARAGQQVSAKQARAGDIYWVDNSTRNNGADHVALYLGGGMILEAARPGTNVRIRRLGENEGGGFTRVL